MLAQTNDKVASIGVLAHRGPDAAVEYWRPLARYLTFSVDGWTFELKPVTLISAGEKVASRQIDFLITNPGHFVTLAEDYPISAIATRERDIDAIPSGLPTYGTAIVVRSGAGIDAIGDLRGKSLAAVSRDAFGGFQIAWSEMREQGIDPFSDLGSLRFMGFPQDAIVSAVAAGTVDAGVVRSGLLESLETEGRVGQSELKVLNSRSQPDYPYLITGHLYPEWPFVSVPGVSKDLTDSVLMALLGTQDAAVQRQFGLKDAWSAPSSYEVVRKLVGDYRAIGGEASVRTASLVYVPAALALLLGLSLLAILIQKARKHRGHDGEGPAGTDDLTREDPSLASARERFEHLTRREREILSLICAGLPSKSIAWELGVSQKTVEFHRSNLLKKTEAGSTAHLVQLATRLGFDLGFSLGENRA